MRILELYSTFLPIIGGVQTHIRDLCKSAQENGHSVFVLTFFMRTRRFRVMDGIPIYNVRVPHSFYFLRFPFLVFYGILLSLLVRMLEIDVIHAHDYLPGLSAAFAGRLARRPVFITLHLPIEFTSGNPLPGTSRIEAFIRAKLLPFIKKIICVSNYTSRSAVMLGVPIHKMVTVHNWVPRKFVELSKELGFTHPSTSSMNNGTHVLSIGRLEKEKGFDILIRAIRILAEKNVNVKLSIIGEGPEKRELVNLSDRLLGRSRIFFLGKVSEREKIIDMMRSDILVIPSRIEGLPLALLEAMALGKATLATRVGGITEIIKNGYNGILTDPLDSSIADSIVSLIHDERQRSRIGLNALGTIRRSFTYHRNCTSVIKILEDCKKE